MLDITAPKIVEVLVRVDEKVLWVNVDGVCVLRVCQIPENGLHVDNPGSQVELEVQQDF